MNARKPSDLEMQILGVLWALKAATARDVLVAMPDGKQRAYTTVLSAMQVMEKKGLLTRTREGVSDRWQPAVTESQVMGSFLRTLVANVFGGRPAVVMQHLLRETEVSDAQLNEIRRLLDNHQSPQTAAHNPREKGK